uniref:Nickel/cobalt transporter regulator n=1 Tax=Candidatus Kentrum sp. LPFa TaxID=2126335 RepID=A0A450W3E6_9GAMM|nr:MAG: hypothetical protein BECKLPF1236A_GA0070988_100555 [Candidatus Kentron sp. LPFa]VFK24555.1 MAG: hypothetical protein BECKLPF1236C_GA0070990_1001420 [Candidatus Kentron sp. LPFa]
MKNLKTTIIAGALSATLAMPAMAGNTSAPRGPAPAQFTEADTQALFAQDVGPMELAMLSPEEMKATDGEAIQLVPVIVYGVVVAYRVYRIYRIGERMYRIYQGITEN